MVAGPLVDDVHRLSVGKVAILRFSIVIVVGLLREVILQTIAKAFVDKDGVGNERLRMTVECLSLLKHLVTELVDAIDTSLAKAQYLIDFLLRLTCRTVVQQPQRVGNAQWRHNAALIATRLAEQVEGKVVVTNYQLLFAFRQLNFLRSIICRGVKPKAFRIDIGQ